MFRPGPALLRGMLLFFWAAWLTVVTATNVLDGLRELGTLPPTWKLASGNYQAIREATARYDVPSAVNGVLFAGVIAWEAITALLFWTAWARLRQGMPAARPAVHAAFAVSLGLWGAFLLADEVLILYSLGGAHLRILTAQLASLLVIELVREGTSAP